MERTNQVNLRSAFKHICANFEAGNAVILKGPPGFGKTDMMGKVAQWMKAKHPGKRAGMSCFFMATQSPIGFTGLPWKGEREYEYGGMKSRWTVTDPAIPQWFLATDLDTGEVRPASLFDVVLLVIEEWGQGGPETKRAGAEVLRAGGTPPFYLPEGSYRIALTNVDASDGVTKEYDFIIGRRVELEVKGDTNVWLEDFADRPYHWQGKTWNVLPVFKSWAKQYPELLFEPKPPKQGPWCNPRTITAASRYTEVMASYSGGNIPFKDDGFIENLSGTVGMNATMSLINHFSFQLELPHLEDIVADPMGTPVPKRADSQMLLAYELAGRVSVETLPPVIQYMTKKPGLPPDLSVTFISSLLRRDYKGMIHQPAMTAWIAKNANLVTIISALNA